MSVHSSICWCTYCTRGMTGWDTVLVFVGQNEDTAVLVVVCMHQLDMYMWGIMTGMSTCASMNLILSLGRNPVKQHPTATSEIREPTQRAERFRRND